MRKAARPATVAAAVLLLLSLVGAAAHAQTSRILIQDAVVSEDGTVSMEVVVSPDVPPEVVDEGLQVVENGDVVPDLAFERLAVGSSAGSPGAEVALLVDTSGSTADGDALGSAAAAAAAFVERVVAEGIPVSLISFSSSPVAVVERSTDGDELTQAISGLRPGGETALYDAVVEAATRLGASDAEDRRLVLFTDGGDTTSVATLEDAQAAITTAELDVTAVSLETTESDADALIGLTSAATAGTVIPVTDAAGLGTAFDIVATNIAERLVVTWTALHPEASQLQISAILVTPTGQFTDRTTVSSPLPGMAQPSGTSPADLPPARAAPPAIIGGDIALWLGLSAAALALAMLFSVIFLAPVSSRSARVLRSQVEPRRRPEAAPPDQPQAPRPELRLKEAFRHVVEALPRPSGYDERLQLQLDRASWPLRSSEFVALRVGLLIAGFFGGGLLSAVLGRPSPVLPITGAVIGWFAPRVILERRKAARIDRFHEQLPETLQMLAGSLRAGYGLAQGLDNVSREGPVPSSTEFGRVLTETRLGVPLEDALAAMAERIGSDDFRWVTVAISIQRKVGGNLAELLDTVATTLREREQVRRQVQVLSAEGRLSAVILIALPIGFALYLSATRPEYLEPLFTWPVGYGLIALSGVLLAAGVAWIRQVIRIDV